MASYQLGEFLIFLGIHHSLSPLLVIEHNERPGQVVWQSLENGKPFVRSSKGNLAINEYQGNFEIDDDSGYITTIQTIENVTREGPTQLRLQGSLSSNGAKQWEHLVPYSVILEQQTANRIDLTVELRSQGASELTHLMLEYELNDQRVFGGGTQYSHLNLKGQRIPLMVAEQGVGRGEEPLTSYLNDVAHGAGGNAFTTYFPVPYYVTDTARCLFLKNTEYTVFDFTQPDTARIHIAREPRRASSRTSTSSLFTLQASIIAAADIPSAVTEFTAWNGRMDPLPEWALRGAIVGLQGGSEVVWGRLKTLQGAGVPVAGLWLQDWSGKRHDPFGSRVLWNWVSADDYYVDWGNMVAQLKERGIRVLSYINPYMTLNVTNYRLNPQRDLFEEANQLGYLVRRSDGQGPYIQESGSEIFKFATIDLTNPAAATWYKEVIKCNLLCVCPGSEGKGLRPGEGGNGVAVSGWMCDFGEFLPMDATLWSGQSPAQVHNDFPRLWAELNREAVREVGLEEDTVFFVRAGYVRSAGAGRLFWLGDQLTTWDAHDGLKTALVGLLSSGLSGNALSHSDLGGYTAYNMTLNGHLYTYQREEELLLRWMEMSAFSDAVFRSHEGNRPLSNSQVYSNPTTLRHLAKFTGIFASLADYKQGLMQEARHKGWPITRPLFWHYPKSPEAWNITTEFLLGSDLLVAPVLDKGEVMRDVYLPAGTWEDVWSCQKVQVGQGGKWLQSHPAPLGQPPLFIVEGAGVGERLREQLNLTCMPRARSTAFAQATGLASTACRRVGGSQFCASIVKPMVNTVLATLLAPILWLGIGRKWSAVRRKSRENKEASGAMSS